MFDAVAVLGAQFGQAAREAQRAAMLVEKDGVVFYGTKNGLLLALDAKTGGIQWQHKIGVGVVNTVTPLSANEVLATDFDGKVTLVSAKN